MSDLEIKDQSTNHHYRTELPNIIYDLGLTGNEFYLYSAIKKCAGDHGQCTQSYKTLATICNSSVPTVKRCLETLCEINPIIKKPLIIKKNRRSQHGDSDTCLITITDIWTENYQIFSGEVKLNPPRVKLNRGVGSKRTDGGVKLSYKQEPMNKNLYEEQQQHAAAFYKSLIEETRLTDANRRALMKFPEEKVNKAIEYSKKIKPKKNLISQLVWFCQEEEEPQVVKKIDMRKEVREKYKHGEIYNGATCWHDASGIAFERGMTHWELKDKDANYEEKLNELLKKVGVK